MFINDYSYPFLDPVANNWCGIKNEMLSLNLKDFSDWPESIYDGDWKVFPLYIYEKKIQKFCDLCPQTAALVSEIPGLVMAGFSRLASGTHITPHVGYTNKVLRFHLGLTQAEKCGLRVGSEIKYWQPGSTFLFDDTTEHEAWNQGNEDRIILMIDFKRDVSENIVFPEVVNNYFADLVSI